MCHHPTKLSLRQGFLAFDFSTGHLFASLFCFLLLAANLLGAEIKPKAGATLKNTYVWDGETLKPRAGASLENIWSFDGRELKSRSGATLSNTWEWNGKEWKTRSNATLARTWEADLCGQSFGSGAFLTPFLSLKMHFLSRPFHCAKIAVSIVRIA